MDKRTDASPSACFLTVVNSKEEAHQARFMIESLRAFGGEMKECPVWIFQRGKEALHDLPGPGEINLLPLDIETPYQRYALADKVFACARAEELAETGIRSLIWLSLDCLIVNPPILFDLDGSHDAALRPVHIRNVGSPIQEPLDDYWTAVYRAIGVEGTPYAVESYVDSQNLRPYFNTHCFSVNPTKGILQAWREHFKALVTDGAFQAGPCREDLHRVFLHQVVLSALITKLLGQERIRRLPPEYSYPLHLQEKIPPGRRIPYLNQTVCPVYEKANLLDGLDIREPLKAWLAAHS